MPSGSLHRFLKRERVVSCVVLGMKWSLMDATGWSANMMDLLVAITSSPTFTRAPAILVGG